MSEVVSDTSPLIALASINQLNLLQKLFGTGTCLAFNKARDWPQVPKSLKRASV